MLLMTVIVSSMAAFGVLNALPLLKISLQNDMKNPKYGESAFVITESSNQMFSLMDIETDEKMTGVVAWYGMVGEEKQIECELLTGDYNVLSEVFHVELITGEKLTKNKEGVIITQGMADEMVLVEGDSIEIFINGVSYIFEVSGILLNQGIFEESTYSVLFPDECLREILEIGEEKVSVAYIYGCDTSIELSEIKVPENLKVQRTIDDDYINSEISMYGILMLFILIFVFFIAFYIIFNLYNILVIERSSYIGTLISCGAKRSYVRRIFLTANIVISVIGGIVSVFIVGIAVVLLSGYVYGVDYLKSELVYMLISAGITIAFAVILGMVSLAIPLNRVLRFSERALICNAVEHNRKDNKLISFIALFITFALWGFTSFYESKNFIFEFVILLVFIIASVMAVRCFVEVIDSLVGKRIGKGKILFALKNVIHNVYIQKNITIIVILLVLMMLVGNLSYSVVKGLTSFYNNYKCNVYFQPSVSFTEEDLDKVDQIEEIESYYTCISKRVVFNGTDEISSFIEKSPEALSEKFLEFNIQWKDFEQEQFTRGRYCIITEVLSKRHELTVGDVVCIQRGEIEAEYEVAAISRSTIEKGNFIFVSPYDIPFENCTTYNMVLANSNDIVKMEDMLEENFTDREFYVTSIADKVNEDKENFTGVIALYFCFVAFVVLIGIQGIYDNFKLSYMNRRKVFAIMLSNGYRMKDIISILGIETIVCNAFGGILSVIYMLLYRQEIIHVMFLMDLALPLHFNVGIMLAPVGLCLMASLISIGWTYGELRKIKGNLIEVLKIY